MNDDRDTQHLDFRRLAADIVAAYVSNNHVQAADLPTLLASVHAAVQVAAEGETSAVVASPVEKPSAAEIRRSVGRDARISFEDGKPDKTLKRHLTGRGTGLRRATIPPGEGDRPGAPECRSRRTEDPRPKEDGLIQRRIGSRVRPVAKDGAAQTGCDRRSPRRHPSPCRRQRPRS